MEPTDEVGWSKSEKAWGSPPAFRTGGSSRRYAAQLKGSNTIMLVSKSKVYEFALSSIKEQHINDFLHEYLPRVSPILTEYGSRFLINGVIQSSIARRFPAKSFAILEWPSIDQFRRINEDKRVIPLVQRRNQYLNFIKEGVFYGVSQIPTLKSQKQDGEPLADRQSYP